MDFTLRLRGQSAELLNELVEEGYSGSKTEAVRAALVAYALQLGLFSRKKLRDNALRAVRASGKSYSDAQIRRQIDSVR